MQARRGLILPQRLFKSVMRLVYPTMLGLSAFLIVPLAQANTCGDHGLALQVLGSGGPEMQDKRASSSYLIWQDGKARVLIDAGGGSALRFGESGANMRDLAVILLTHLHADHTADLPALIKSSYFEDRTQPLPLYGPTGNALFPSTVDFINALFGSAGAYRYLNDFIAPAATTSYLLQAHDVAVESDVIKTVYAQQGIKVSAIGVGHGAVPAIAWRLDMAGKSIVFSGDTNGDGDHLVRLAQSANLLVAHNAVPEAATGPARRLHMPPSVIGAIATQAQVSQLVLSHRMLRTLGREAQTLQYIKQTYQGEVVFANDLDCFVLDADKTKRLPEN